jgi:hypothetical protein
VNTRLAVAWLRRTHEEFTESPLLAVMLVLSFHSLADGVMRSGYVIERPLAWLWAFGIDYAIWAGYRRIRQGHWEGWLLVVPGSAATVLFQTILAGKALTWHALVPPGFVVVSLFVMERIRRDARPGQSWHQIADQVEALRGSAAGRDHPARGRSRAPVRLAAPAPDGPPPQSAAGRAEGDQGPAEAPAPAVGAAWTPQDLADMVRVYETATGGTKARRSAVTAHGVIPWAVVEAELKRQGLIETRVPETNGNEA